MDYETEKHLFDFLTESNEAIQKILDNHQQQIDSLTKIVVLLAEDLDKKRGSFLKDCNEGTTSAEKSQF
jgi:hypothetical protein